MINMIGEILVSYQFYTNLVNKYLFYCIQSLLVLVICLIQDVLYHLNFKHENEPHKGNNNIMSKHSFKKLRRL